MDLNIYMNTTHNPTDYIKAYSLIWHDYFAFQDIENIQHINTTIFNLETEIIWDRLTVRSTAKEFDKKNKEKAPYEEFCQGMSLNYLYITSQVSSQAWHCVLLAYLVMWLVIP